MGPRLVSLFNMIWIRYLMTIWEKVSISLWVLGVEI